MRPESETELAEMVRAAQGPLAIRGGGTRGVALQGAALETGGLSGITLYEPGALTLVAGAGTPLAEVEAALAAEGQRLAFEPMDHRALLGTEGAPTLGGVVAANVSGPRRIQAGAARDYCLGVRFVDGAGTVVKNGGRVMKNVTGYDLVKLMAGAHGTLGVLTEVALKVLPRPEAAASVRIEGLSDAEAIAAMARALGSPYDVSGAAHLPQGRAGTPLTLLRLEGFAGSVAYRAEKLAALFPDRAVQIDREADAVAAEWLWLRDAGPLQEGSGDLWRISVKPSEAPDLVARLAPLAHLYDWGGGLVWLRLPAGRDARAAMAGLGGHATRLAAADAALPRFQPEPAPVAALSAALRQRFDPRGILNPGLMG
jgi:glycolate oxidase FAD binding subunit